jgi:hypothetical protein
VTIIKETKKRNCSLGILVPNLHRGRQLLLLYHRLQRKTADRRLKHIRLFAFTAQDVDWAGRTINGLQPAPTPGFRKLRWRRTRRPLPTAILNTVYGPQKTFAEQLRRSGAPSVLLNSVTQLHKWQTHHKMRRGPLAAHVPETHLFHPTRVLAMLRKYGTIFIKPALGNRGERVLRVLQTANGEVQIAHHREHPFVTCDSDDVLLHTLNDWCNESTGEMGGGTKRATDWLVQQGIAGSTRAGQSYDIRALVQKTADAQWQVTMLTMRLARRGHYNTGIYDLMLRVPPSPLATTIRDLAIRAANVMETKNDAQHELSVDFIVDRQRHPWIIEVNGSPQKKIYRDLRGFRDWGRLYRTPLQLTWSHYQRGTLDR